MIDPLPEILQDAAARSGTYRLLARMWLAEVDAPLLQTLQDPKLRDSFLAAGGVLSCDLALEELSLDYCRLFIGPTGHLPPYQSVWESGQLQGAMAVSMERFIEITDYPVLALPSGTILDHLGVQLDVMGHLLADFVSRSFDTAATLEVSELALSCFARHLTWPDDLLDAAALRATTEFYRAVIGMTRDFLACERKAANIASLTT